MAAVTAPRIDFFLTLQEAADVLKISERSLRSAVAAGEVRSMRLGKRIVRIPRDEIERLRRGEPIGGGCTGNRSAQAAGSEITTT